MSKVVTDPRLLEVATVELKKLGCPDSKDKVRQWAHTHVEKGHRSIRHVNELAKLDLTLFAHADAHAEKRAVTELQAHFEQRRTSTKIGLPKLRVWDAISLHKTVCEMGGGAEFKQAAQEMFPYSTYFHDK